jgi:hypothetical protein
MRIRSWSLALPILVFLAFSGASNAQSLTEQKPDKGLLSVVQKYMAKEHADNLKMFQDMESKPMLGCLFVDIDQDGDRDALVWSKDETARLFESGSRYDKLLILRKEPASYTLLGTVLLQRGTPVISLVKKPASKYLTIEAEHFNYEPRGNYWFENVFSGKAYKELALPKKPREKASSKVIDLTKFKAYDYFALLKESGL